jgi:hypothetical protein
MNQRTILLDLRSIEMNQRTNLLFLFSTSLFYYMCTNNTTKINLAYTIFSCFYIQ